MLNPLSPKSTLRLALRHFGAVDPFRMAGATAFFTLFALPPMLIIVVRTFGLFMDRRTVGESIITPMRGIMGDGGVEMILQTVRSFRELQENMFIAAGIFLFLLFVATTLFRIIRNSINDIWMVRRRKGIRIGETLRARAWSAVVILAGGFLFLFVQLLSAAIQLLGRHLRTPVFTGAALQWILVTVLTALWFFLVFLVIPYARPDRKIAAKGALLTAVLFQGGKVVLGLMLQPVRVTGFYGVSGTILLLLLFMFYSALFLYFGVAVIRAWSETSGRPLKLRPHAEFYCMQTLTGESFPETKIAGEKAGNLSDRNK